ncbi:MAG: AMIN domain-containing protein [Gemmatimonadales bacterium]
MTRAPLSLRAAAGPLGLAAVLLAAAPPRAVPPTVDVTAVSLQPSRGRAELVIDVRGPVEVSDFVLASPARLVVDLVGARLVAPVMRYDGVPRGGVRNVRYAQFRPDVVRVVVELDSARDYDVRQDSQAVRVGIQGAQEFASWSSDVSRGSSRLVETPASAPAPAVAAPAAPAAPAASSVAASLPAAMPAPAPASARASARAVPPSPNPLGLTAAATTSETQARVSVTFDHSSIEEVVATFAAFSGRSIVLGKDATGTVTAEVHDQPWDYALNAILAGQGLGAAELPGGIIRIDSKANLNATDSLEPLVQRIVPINYAKATSLQPSLLGIVSARGKVIADSVTNSIIVTETRARALSVDSFIQSLDQRTPQIAIQARIVSVNRTELEDLGLQYDLGTSTQFFNQLVARNDPSTPGAQFPSTTTVVNIGGNAVAAIANASQALADGSPALNLVYSTVVGNFALTAFLQALQTVTLADVQAEPSVTVADNRSATLFSGQDSPIRTIDLSSTSVGGGTPPRATTSFKSTGIKLQVTPHVVHGTREIMMLLHAERSSVTASAITDIGATFNNDYADTQLLVRDGETIVIGGLTVTEITVSKSGIPFLVDLPVVGALFGFRNNKEVRQDLLILVTPHIVDDFSTTGTGEQPRP